MSLIHRCAIALAVLAALPMAARAAPAAQAETYGFDPVHTRVVFAISHAGFSQAIGTVSGSAGTLSFDRDDWRSAKLEVQVPLTRLDLGDSKWNKAALASNLLDGKRYPLARFVSERVEPVAGDADRFQACGQLTLHGVTAPLCMDVKLNQLKRHPLPPFHRTAGFSATARLSRAAFGIDAWKSVIGDEVELRIEAEAVRDKFVGATPKANPADADSTDTEATGTEPVDSQSTDTPSTAPAKPRPEPSR